LVVPSEPRCGTAVAGVRALAERDLADLRKVIGDAQL
jgi:hypothetical protein